MESMHYEDQLIFFQWIVGLLVVFICLFVVLIVAVLWDRRQSVANAKSTLPMAPPRSRVKTNKYLALRFTSLCLRIIGWLFFILAMLAFLVLAVVFAVAESQHLPILSLIATPLVMPFVVAAFVIGLMCIAFGETIKLFIDIAYDTEQISDTIRQIEHAQSEPKAQPQRTS